MTTCRSSSYTCEEDILICEAYVEISQDPIVGNGQSGNRLWSRIEAYYNSNRPNTMGARNLKSLNDRFNIMKAAVRSLNACIVQVERENPSGASNEDIMHRAKELLRLDPKYKKHGFRFDHVFSQIKDAVEVGSNTQRRKINFSSSQSDASVPNSPVFSSPGVSSFNINLSDDTDGGSSSQIRPEGVKKAKLKRKKGEDSFRAIKSVDETNKKIVDVMAESNVQQKKAIDEFARRAEQRRDDKIMDKDLTTIEDPNRREWSRNEQFKIMQKSANQTQFGNPFGQYFGNIGGSGSDLGEY